MEKSSSWSILKRIFNVKMIAGAVLAWIIVAGLSTIWGAAIHVGGGIVNYEENSKHKAPNDYRRHKYAEGGMMVLVGGFLWVLVATHRKPSKGYIEPEMFYMK